MRKVLTVFFVIFGLSLPAQAQAQAQQRQDISQLFGALHLDEIFDVMRKEGMAMGKDLGEEMLPGGSDPYWEALLRQIHDTDSMRDIIYAAFEEALTPEQTGPILTFFESDIGQQFVEREVSTRLLFLDAAAEEGARSLFRDQAEPFDAHLSAISAYIEANELIEMNVAGALNSNFLFYRGMASGGGMAISEDDMLRDVWAQEEATREDTREWLFAFLMAAYEPLSAEDITQYVTFSLSDEGQALNRALFAGFDQMYGAISLSLGVALAKQMEGETL